MWTIAYIGEEGGDNNISIVGQGSHTQRAQAVNVVFAYFFICEFVYLRICACADHEEGGRLDNNISIVGQGSQGA